MSEIKKLGSSWVFNHFFGFNQIPTNEDSSIYIKSVLIAAKGDGVLSSEERDWATGFAASWGVADWVIEEVKKAAMLKAEGSYVAMQCRLQTYTDCEPPNMHILVGGLNPWLPSVEIEGSGILGKG